MSGATHLTTWGAAWRLVRCRPGVYALAVLLGCVYECMPILTGLALRAFFDRLTGSAPAGLNAWSLLGLLLASEVAHALTLVAWDISGVTSAYTFGSLLRRNLLAWLFQGPGARALPDSSGESVSRFRDDVDEFYNYLEGWIDLVPTVVRTGVALAIMLAIDPALTVAVLVPLLAIVATTNLAGARVQRYRAASRAAAGRVAGFIGEVFGAVGAINANGAEERAGAHFDRLNEARAGAALRDTVATSARSAPAWSCCSGRRSCAPAASRSATWPSSSSTCAGPRSCPSGSAR